MKPDPEVSAFSIAPRGEGGCALWFLSIPSEVIGDRTGVVEDS